MYTESTPLSDAFHRQGVKISTVSTDTSALLIFENSVFTTEIPEETEKHLVPETRSRGCVSFR